MTPHDFHFFSGYVWYAYPIDDTKDFNPALLEYPGAEAKMRLRIKDFVGAASYSNYREEGILLITDTAQKPEAPHGWEIVPLSVPDGFGGMVNENTLVRHIYTATEAPISGSPYQPVFSFFVGLEIPPKV